MNKNQFVKYFSEESLWEKIKQFSKSAGVKVVYAALLLYYVMNDKRVSLKNQTVDCRGAGLFYPSYGCHFRFNALDWLFRRFRSASVCTYTSFIEHYSRNKGKGPKKTDQLVWRNKRRRTPGFGRQNRLADTAGWLPGCFLLPLPAKILHND